MDRAAPLKELAMMPLEWTEAVAAHMGAAIAKGDVADPLTVDWLYAEYRDGRLAFVGAFIDGVHVATAAYRIEGAGHDAEFVVVVCGAALNGMEVIQHFLPSLEKMARWSGCELMRFHTTRPGLIHLAQAAGYHEAEIVMRKRLSDGH